MLDIVITYYNQPDMLAVQQLAWENYPEGVRVIVVDDGSQVPAKADGCEIYRVKQDIPWHQDGARNLGAHVATADWLLFLDIDHVIGRDELDKLLSLIPDAPRGMAYRPERRLVSGAYKLKPAANIWAIRRMEFWKVGGYDERLCGHYGTDQEFIPRLRRRLNVETIPVTLDVYTKDVVSDAATLGLDREVVALPRLHGRPVTMDFEWEQVQ